MSRTTRIAFLAALIGLALAAPRAAGQTIDNCGTLIHGINQCVLFRLGDGTTYLLSREDGFAVGALVHVVGAIEPTCFSICNPANGCISVQTISTCQGFVLPPGSVNRERCGLCGIPMAQMTLTGMLGCLAARYVARRRTRRRQNRTAP